MVRKEYFESETKTDMLKGEYKNVDEINFIKNKSSLLQYKFSFIGIKNNI